MAELGLKASHPTFIHELQRKRQRGMLTKRRIKCTARDYGLQPIGAGFEHVVVRYPQKSTHIPDRVVAIHHEYLPQVQDNLSAKLTFYYQNMLASLYPNNFPRIHAAFGNNNRWLAITGTVREYVEKRKKRDIFRRRTHPFSRARNEWRQAGLELGIDTGRLANFITTPEGKQYYVDLVKISPEEVPQVVRAAAHIIQSREYSEATIRNVSRYATRLLQLAAASNR